MLRRGDAKMAPMLGGSAAPAAESETTRTWRLSSVLKGILLLGMSRGDEQEGSASGRRGGDDD